MIKQLPVDKQICLFFYFREPVCIWFLLSGIRK